MQNLIPQNVLARFVYRLYLQSPGWRLTRTLRKTKFCSKCGYPKRLELHHDTYDWHNRYKVLRWLFPNLSDRMRTLCDRCHRLEHKK